MGCSPLIIDISNNSSVNTAGNFTWNIGSANGTPDNNNAFTLDYENISGDTVVHSVSLSDTNNYGCGLVYEKEMIHPWRGGLASRLSECARLPIYRAAAGVLDALD